MSARRPIFWATPRSPSGRRPAAQSPMSIGQWPWPILRHCLRTSDRPKSSSVATSLDQIIEQIPVQPPFAGRLAGRPSAPPQSARAPAYRRPDDACGLSPSCQRHSLYPPFSAALDALSVQHGGGGFQRSAGHRPDLLPQELMNHGPGAVASKAIVVMPTSRPFRQVVGDGPPRAAVSNQIQDAVEHLADTHAPRASTPFFGWNVRFDPLPLTIRQVRWVCPP